MADHDLHAVAFPTLTEAQIATLGRCAKATLQRYRDGQKLFEIGALVGPRPGSPGLRRRRC
jgi:thioredoxin reductase (NADPH)